VTLNTDRLRGKLSDISRALARLKTFQAMSREDFLTNEDAQDILRSRLLTAIEASLNICYHLSAKKLQAIPDDYAHCFTLLANAGLVSQDLAKNLAVMARFRNRLVHLYWEVDYGQVHEILNDHLEDLEAFASRIADLIQS
jgi:uncharacterized protein YutE (UPF0331/DUF86 family)